MSGTGSRSLAGTGLLDPATATAFAAIGLCTVAFFLADDSSLAAEQQRQSAPAATSACPQNDAGITLPPGFCATVFADDIGHARHLVVVPNGVVYVNTWSGRYYGNTPPHAGGFLVALRDTTGDGRADVVTRFGPEASSGNAGGTGIAFYNGAHMQKRTTASCAMRCRRARSRRLRRPKSSFPDCRSPAIIRLIRSQSIRKARSTSTWARPPTRVRSRIA